MEQNQSSQLPNYEAIVGEEHFDFHGDNPQLAYDHIKHHASAERARIENRLGKKVEPLAAKFRRKGSVNWTGVNTTR